MKKLYLSWQDPINRRWLPVGRLTRHRDYYRFVYTKGAKVSKNFTPFGRMKKLYDIYDSRDIFPLFANRLMPPSRPEYRHFISWLDIPKKESNPFVILALTGGIRKTDSLEIFPCPEPTPDGYYLVKFFNRGLSHLSKDTLNRVNDLKRGDRLYLMTDLQNPVDSLALALRTEAPFAFAGYCPRYFTHDLNWLINECDPNNIKVTVIQNNNKAPFQLRLLCKITCRWPNNFNPCSGDLFEPLPDNLNDEASCKLNFSIK